ncbi:hypothetical protein GCM10017044_04960 [Kordiimonas sediminis]|uniref:Uncharacterized protein n=1 Tax=Kordiimonas sediminis TaxID=1735581 RepID=A0A919AN31_9PROT|nr:hypothetical protein [Kordiimonas sediminis]GHF13880.1 hypothetical protein GCM10017044_04960 [Kordiimonas sediminis]
MPSLGGGGDLLSDFHEWNNGKRLCVLPVPRLLLHHKLTSDDTIIYPADSVDLSPLNIVSTPRDEFHRTISRGGGELDWMKAACTQISLDDLSGNALMAFYMTMDWRRFLSGDHDYHLDLLVEASEIGNRFLDVVRYDYCNLAQPETLPGSPGSLMAAQGPFSTAIFYSNDGDHEAYMTAGQTISHHLSTGLGLELHSHGSMTTLPRGDVGQVIRHALRLRSVAMESNSNSTKFISALSVIDFLAAPAGYISHKDMGKVVGLHMASSRQGYDPVLRRFEELTGGKGSGVRTKLVHEGLRLEDILGRADITALFREVDRYICKIIHDLLQFEDAQWRAVEQYREERKYELGLKSDG